MGHIPFDRMRLGVRVAGLVHLIGQVCATAQVRRHLLVQGQALGLVGLDLLLPLSSAQKKRTLATERPRTQPVPTGA